MVTALVGKFRVRPKEHSGSDDIVHILDSTECNRRHEYLCSLRSLKNANIKVTGRWIEGNETHRRLAIKEKI